MLHLWPFKQEVSFILIVPGPLDFPHFPNLHSAEPLCTADISHSFSVTNSVILKFNTYSKCCTSPGNRIQRSITCVTKSYYWTWAWTSHPPPITMVFQVTALREVSLPKFHKRFFSPSSEIHVLPIIVTLISQPEQFYVMCINIKVPCCINTLICLYIRLSCFPLLHVLKCLYITHHILSLK